MNTNQQAQVDTEEEEEEEVEEDQLLEIYKLHAQLASDIANRLTTTNRFYPTLMSGVLAFFIAILRGSDLLISEEIYKKI